MILEPSTGTPGGDPRHLYLEGIYKMGFAITIHDDYGNPHETNGFPRQIQGKSSRNCGPSPVVNRGWEITKPNGISGWDF